MADGEKLWRLVQEAAGGSVAREAVSEPDLPAVDEMYEWAVENFVCGLAEWPALRCFAKPQPAPLNAAERPDPRLPSHPAANQRTGGHARRFWRVSRFAGA